MPFLYRRMNLQKHTARVLRAHDLLCPQRTLLVACSGGTDSLVLLEVLNILRAADGAQLVCAHYEHGIRGAEARADARFVAGFCAARGIPFVLGTGDVPAYARAHGHSIETAARICRYDFLHRVRAERGCDAVVLAHHADDLAETVLLRILRGTGSAGLVGMREWNGLHLRPFLVVTRAQLARYAAERGLTPRHDATNDTLDARRNRVRHELLPYLAHTYNPAVRDALTRLSGLAAEEEDLLTHLAEDAYGCAACPGGLSLAVLRTLHVAMQRRVLRLFWMRTTGTAQDFSYLHEERLRALVSADHAVRVEMQRGWYAVARYGVLTLMQLSPMKVPLENEEILLPLSREYAIINFQGMEFHLRRLSRMTADDWRRAQERTAVYADPAALPTLVLRTRRAGDYMRLPVGRRKLKDILIDDKIPREERDTLPLLAIAGTSEIFWIAGGRRSVLAPVTIPGEPVVRIAYDEGDDSQ